MPLSNLRLPTALPALALLMLLTACGGGSDSSFEPLPEAPTITAPPKMPDSTAMPAPTDRTTAAYYEASGEYQPRYADVEGVTQTDTHLDLIHAAAAYARGATGQGEAILFLGGYIRALSIYDADQDPITFPQPIEIDGGDHREFRGNNKVALLGAVRLSSFIPPVTHANSLYSTQIASIMAGGRDQQVGLNMHGVAFDAEVFLYYSESATPDREPYAPLEFNNRAALEAHPRTQEYFKNGAQQLSENARETIKALGDDDLADVILLGRGDNTDRLISDSTSDENINRQLESIKRMLDNRLSIVQTYFSAPFPIDTLDPSRLQDEATREDRLNNPIYGRVFYQLQAHRTAADKVIIASPAGDNGRLTFADGIPAPKNSPNVFAALGVAYPGLQGHTLAVVALDQDGTIADYSNRCGIAQAFCEAAPGSQIVTASSLSETAYTVTAGSTSFAAAVVSGAVAVVRQHFRGQLGNTAIVTRLKSTANRTGIYSDAAIYGQGLIDLDAATAPVGEVMTGLPHHSWASLSHSRLVVPAAYGGAIRQGFGQIEIAGFDTLGHPFWTPATQFIVQPSNYDLQPNPWLPALGEQAGLVPFLPWQSTQKHTGGLHLSITPGRLGFSGSLDQYLGAHHLLRGLRAGFLFEQNSHQATRPAGAFGDSVAANMVFISHERAWAAPHTRWRAHTRVLLANSTPDYQAGMFEASGSWYSSAAFALEYDNQHQLTRWAVEQPLRAESGQGNLRYPVGRTPEGTRLFDSHQFSLVPAARAIHFSVSHYRPLPVGRIGLQLKHILNARHMSGRQDTWIGTAYQLTW